MIAPEGGPTPSTWTWPAAFARTRGNMSTPQDSPRRRKQKARRTKQLDEWRLKKATAAGAGAAKPAAKKTEKKTEKKAK